MKLIGYNRDSTTYYISFDREEGLFNRQERHYRDVYPLSKYSNRNKKKLEQLYGFFIDSERSQRLLFERIDNDNYLMFLFVKTRGEATFGVLMDVPEDVDFANKAVKKSLIKFLYSYVSSISD